MDDVETGLRNINAKAWRKRALERTEWTLSVKETRAKSKALHC
jgi:hypothetical protein